MDQNKTLTESFHVVALSGGKDSTAMALRLAEVEPRDYLYVCTPTGNEPPDMLAHWSRLGELLGKPVVPIVAGTLTMLIEKQNALPNWRQRWCTRMLKIEPYARFLTALSSRGAITSYVGLRADEPAREGGDYLDIPGITQRYPLREWGWELDDVLGYLDERAVCIPPRTDCQLCFFQRLIEWYELWRDDPAAYAEGERLEALTGYTFRSPDRDTWPASMAELRKEFERGRVPRETRSENMRCRVCRL